MKKQKTALLFTLSLFTFVSCSKDDILSNDSASSAKSNNLTTEYSISDKKSINEIRNFKPEDPTDTPDPGGGFSGGNGPTGSGGGGNTSGDFGKPYAEPGSGEGLGDWMNSGIDKKTSHPGDTNKNKGGSSTGGSSTGGSSAGGTGMSGLPKNDRRSPNEGDNIFN